MRQLNQNDMDYILAKVDRGEITMLEANVEMVRTEGIRVIKGKLRSDVRKALNYGVKAGKLRHIKKDGMKPEVYYNPNSGIYVNGVRNRYVEHGIRVLSSVISGTTETLVIQKTIGEADE